MIKVLKYSVKFFLFLLIIVFVCSMAFIWYNFYDVTGLTLYEDEVISDIVPYYDRIYVITENGNGYVAGDYDSSSRKYRNSESYSSDKLGTPTPVRFYDGVITKINPYSGGAVFINSNAEVFDFDDFNAHKIHDAASYAIRASYEHGRKFFGKDNEEFYYIIDTEGTLYAIDGKGKMKEIFRDVSSVDYYLDTIFVLFKNGNLDQYCIENDGTIKFEKKVFENAYSFDVEDTSLRYDGSKFVFDDEEAKNTPLINVLTIEGDLYAIGAYNLLCCTRSISSYPSPKIIGEWTLVAKDIESFSLAPMGTAIKFKNGTVGYYGFDTDNSIDSKFEFGYIQLNLTNAIDVHASDVQILVKTDQSFYIWGYSLIYNVDECEHNLFTDSPIIIKP